MLCKKNMACKFNEKSYRKRFWSKVIKTDECWIFKGSMRDGYPQFSRRKRIGGSTTNAHRLAWEFRHGKIPTNMQILHKCDNRSCVRLSHLFMGTLQDNMKDRNSKGRQAKGERCGRATLSEAVAREILALRHPTGFAPWGYLRDVAEKYSLDRQTVSNIWRGKTWRHL